MLIGKAITFSIQCETVSILALKRSNMLNIDSITKGRIRIIYFGPIGESMISKSTHEISIKPTHEISIKPV